jgi:hypothetical protein
MNDRHVLLLKRGLLAFWAVWLTVVFTTNVLDGAKALGWLPESWTFTSGNYEFLATTTARYGTADWVNGILFLGVVCWEGIAAMLFWLAFWTFGSKPNRRRLLYAAFTAGLLLWSAFLVADEIFIAYPLEATHLRLFIAQLMTLLAIELLPDNSSLPRS